MTNCEKVCFFLRKKSWKKSWKKNIYVPYVFLSNFFPEMFFEKLKKNCSAEMPHPARQCNGRVKASLNVDLKSSLAQLQEV